MKINKGFLQIFAFLLLFILIIGTVTYGIKNEKIHNLEYKGVVYKEQASSTFENRTFMSKDNHHIYVKVDNETYDTTITIEDDGVVITIIEHYEFSIEKDGKEFASEVDYTKDFSDNEYKDYIDLVFSYIRYESFMDEFPGVLVFSFLAIFPLTFGLILIFDVFRNRKQHGSNLVSALRYIRWSILSILFIGSYAMLILSIVRNT